MIQANFPISSANLDKNVLLPAIPGCVFPSVLRIKSSKVFRSFIVCSSNSSISEAVLEKEVKFSPAFEDYLKVLEFVRTNRSKNSGEQSDVDPSDSLLVSRGSDNSRVLRRNPSKSVNKGDNGGVALKVKSKKLFNVEGDVSDKKISFLKVTNRGNRSQKKHSDRVFSKVSMFNNRDDDDGDGDDHEVALRKHAGISKVLNGGANVSEKKRSLLEERYKGNISHQKHLNRRLSKAPMFNNTDDDDGGGDGEREVALKKHGGVSKVWNVEDDVSKKKRSKGNRSLRQHSDRVLSRVDDDKDNNDGHYDVIDDRPAFKTFEVFTDINNRPRVLRMELEERIQKLANRLNAADINMPDWKFSRMMYSGNIKFSDHSILRVVQLLGKYGNWRRVLQVVQWVQSSQPFKSYKSRYIYTTVLSALGKAKRPVEALNVFYSMRKEVSSYPDLAAYHCIAVILGRAGMMKELFDVIDCMRSRPDSNIKLGMLQKWNPCLEPDLVVFNAVLNACIQEKQWEGAFWVLQELKKKGIKPTSTTYGLVMEVMLVCGKFNLVHEFFDKIQKSSVPGALSYKVLVNAFWREGKVEEAILAVKQMESRGVVGPASLYYDLARCLCAHGRCQEALQLIDKMADVAQKPLVVTYTGLIQACLDSGSLTNATLIFNQMANFCNPNLVTCNIMLNAYKENGLYLEAKKLFQMILDGDALIGREKVNPDNFTFNTMLEACIEAERWDDFEYVYVKMLECGLGFNVKRHLRMVMEASRAGKVKLVDITYHHLIESGRTPPAAILEGRQSFIN